MIMIMLMMMTFGESVFIELLWFVYEQIETFDSRISIVNWVPFGIGNGPTELSTSTSTSPNSVINWQWFSTIPYSSIACIISYWKKLQNIARWDY